MIRARWTARSPSTRTTALPGTPLRPRRRLGGASVDDMPRLHRLQQPGPVCRADAGSFNYNFNNDGAADDADPTFKKYVYLFPNGVCGANCDTRSYDDANHSHFAVPPTPQFASFRSSDHNKQYYNPTTTCTCPGSRTTTVPATARPAPPPEAGRPISARRATPTPTTVRSHPIYGSDEHEPDGNGPAEERNQHYIPHVRSGCRSSTGADYRALLGTRTTADTCESWRTKHGQLSVHRRPCPPAALHGVPRTVAFRTPYCRGRATTTSTAAIEYFPATLLCRTTTTFVNYGAYAASPLNSMNGVADLKGPDLRSDVYLVEIKPTTSRTRRRPPHDCAGPPAPTRKRCRTSPTGSSTTASAT